MNPITNIKARQILDSRGWPTLEVEVETAEHTEVAKVPSGASTGSHEALELRDGDPKMYLGKGVLKAVEHVNTVIEKALIGQDPTNQKHIDDILIKLDGTPNKSNLGANAMVGVSMAIMRLGAKVKNIPLYQHIGDLLSEHTDTKVDPVLPTPMMNVINGGKHADSGLSVQECMIVPINITSFHEALRIGAEVFQHLKKLLVEKGFTTSVGDEGGFAPKVATTEEALALIMQAAMIAGHKDSIGIAIDAAASEFYENGVYTIDGKELNSNELTSHFIELSKKFPIVSLEDSHSEDDFVGFTDITEKLGSTLQLVGDDLFVTNEKRLQLGIDQKMANAILIKLNQIGTVSETLSTIALARKNNYNYIISHRSGETEDTTIADFAVGTGSGQIKTGSLSRSERIAKYNRLLKIEEELGENAKFCSPF